MEDFYHKEAGYCLSTTINKYVYVSIVPNSIRDGLRIMHDTTIDAKSLDEVKNVLVRESLRYFNSFDHMTIASQSNIKASGNGLGSSSAFTVGLLNILWMMYKGEAMPSWDLARAACEVEIEKAGQPIGKQDQYASAVGGLNLWRFAPAGSVERETSSDATKALRELQENSVLLYSGVSHNASDILRKQNATIKADKKKFQLLKNNAERAKVAYELLKKYKINEFGELLHEGWMDKKAVTEDISTPRIDEIYDFARKKGCSGGKILGAGGGGFFFFFFPKLVDKKRFCDTIYSEFPETVVYNPGFVDKGSEVYKV